MLLAFAVAARAAVATDGSVGAAGAISKVGNDFAIPGTLGQQRGGNLFHSFSEFNLATGESATFSGPGSVSNIFARVTGGGASTIDGTIRSTIAGANLFLMNPNGVMFGPNAAIDVSGSFTATTASYLKLSDGGRFDAVAPAGDSLTAAPLSAFGFLGTPAAITLDHSQITSQTGKGVSLIGGSISMTSAKIAAPEGRVDIAAAKNGELPADISRLTRAQSRVANGGMSLLRSTVDTGGVRGGAVFIRGGQLTMDRSVIISKTTGANAGAAVDARVSGQLQLTLNSRVFTETSGAGAAGDVILRAGRLQLETDSLVGSQARSDALAASRAGHVQIQANALSISNEATITASTFGAGRGNIVDVNAGKLDIRGTSTSFPTGIVSNTNAATGGGAGGGVRVHAGTLAITDGGRISADTFGSARGGDVEVLADSIFLAAHGSANKTGFFSDTNSLGAGGHGGEVRVHAEHLQITDGGLISTKTLGLGACGDVRLDIGLIEISRGGSKFFTGVAADSPVNRGPGGNVFVNAGTVHLFDGGQISANTSSNGLGGPGGNVSVHADDILLEGGRVLESKISAESVSPGDGGDGGNVDVVAKRLRILDGARISASTFGGGAGGDVSVRADEAIISDGGTGLFTGIAAGTVSTLPGAGAGGKVNADFNMLTLESNGSILAQTFGPGAGGELHVKADTLRMTSGGSITATSQGAGAGGGVTVDARLLTMEDNASIEASATARGTAGSVAITVEEPLTLQSGAGVRTTSDISDAGTVSIHSATSIEMDDASITVRATKGNAGSIVLVMPEQLKLNNSSILAEAGLNGGSVFIDPQYVILDHSRISANAILGAGGAITIIADSFLSSSSAVTASSEASVQGTVEIQSPDAQLANALTPLSASFVGIETRLQERCAMRLGGDFSTFLVVGRGGVPPAPEDLLLSPARLQLDLPRR